MVATIQVLKGSASGIADYFAHEQASDYYAAERNGEWFGGGADRLKLSGEIDRRSFQNLMAGVRDDGSQITGKRTNKTPGYDLTFSVPKSVSLAWALSDMATQKSIEAATMRAVKSTLDDVTEIVPLGRRGKGGKELIHGELAAALFFHFTNREQEPQLHIHAVLANCLFGSDGRWSAINSRLLHNWTPTLGRMFRCNLAHELKQDLRPKLHRPMQEKGKKASWFEIRGIKRSAIEAFSSRKQAIDERINGDGPKLGKVAAKARERANLRTRRKKEVSLKLGELHELWKELGQAHDLTKAAIESLFGKRVREPSVHLIPKALRAATEELTERIAHFTACDVIREVCEKLQHHGFSAKQITGHVVQQLEQSPDYVRLEKQGFEYRYTTLEMWRTEEKLLSNVSSLAQTSGAEVKPKTIERVIRESPTLYPEQEKAVRNLLSATSRMRSLTGLAGAGKSFTLNTVRAGFEREGYKVLGGALAGAAKEELSRQSGIESRTVESLLYHLDNPLAARAKDGAKRLASLAGGTTKKNLPQVKLTTSHVLILDEAGMLGTRQLGRLVQKVRDARATLILCGDPDQLNPIEAGGPFRWMSKEFSTATLANNMRQKSKSDRNAVAAIRSGEATEAIKSYAQRGLVSIGKNHGDAIKEAVSAWCVSGGRITPQDHMVFVQTRAEANAVNRLCQHERLRARPSQRKQAAKFGKDRYYAGDRVMFNAPYRSKFIENGFSGTITSIKSGKLIVRLDNEPSARAKRRGASRFVSLAKRDVRASKLSLGYAATTHKMQGQTVAHSYLLLCGGMTSRQMAYTQATRAKSTTRIFVDELSAGEELCDLTRKVGQSRAKTLAQSVGLRRNSHNELRLG